MLEEEKKVFLKWKYPVWEGKKRKKMMSKWNEQQFSFFFFFFFLLTWGDSLISSTKLLGNVPIWPRNSPFHHPLGSSFNTTTISSSFNEISVGSVVS
jgi:hypothetical protein